MIHETPDPSDADLAVLERLEELRASLRFFLKEPRRWFGTLRRATIARAVQGSNSIEGYHASVEDVAAVLDDEEPLEADEETRQAISGYRDAMTYVLQAAGDGRPVDESLLKSLHFMMMKYDLSKHPGLWRPGAIWVEDETGATVYTAPERDLVEPLIGELLVDVATDDTPVLVQAAMAHLNLTMIHPFSDGNGRMARCLQSLVLARDGNVSPEFLSIEEYLGRNTRSYYEVLTSIAQGKWRPEASARPWIKYCLTAHYRQAHTLLRRVRETEALWDRCEQLADKRRVPGRSVAALCDAARGSRIRRSLYVKRVRAATGEEITDATATRDLRSLVDAGLLLPMGEKRGRQYLPTVDLGRAWLDIRSMRAAVGVQDPYESLAPELPGLGS
jgi:Fic family protein